MRPANAAASRQSFGADRLQDRNDGARVALPLADRANADPHPRFEPVSILVEVIDIVGRLDALEHRHDRHGETAGCQRVVSLDGQALVVPDRQAGFRDHPRLAHIVLRDGRADTHDPRIVQPADLGLIVLDGSPVAAVHGKLGERAAVEKDFRAIHRLSPPAQAVDADTGAIEVAGITWLVKADKKFERTPTGRRLNGRLR